MRAAPLTRALPRGLVVALALARAACLVLSVALCLTLGAVVVAALCAAPAGAMTPGQMLLQTAAGTGALMSDFGLNIFNPSNYSFGAVQNATYVPCDGPNAGLITAFPNQAGQRRRDCTGGTPNGLLVEEGRTNSVPNSSWTGATSSSPGTGWGAPTTANGIALSFASGTENGLPYIDATFSGTATAATTVVIQSPQFAVTNGLAYTASTYLSVKNGSLSSNVNAYYGMNIFNSGGSYLQTSIEQNIATNPASTSLLNNRYSQSATLNVSSAAFSTYVFGIIVPNGQVVNHTIRFGGVQIEQGGFVSSVILTTSGPVARTADVAQFAGQALALLQGGSGAALLTAKTANGGNGPRLIGTNATFTDFLNLSFGNTIASYNGTTNISVTSASGTFLNASLRGCIAWSPNGRTMAIGSGGGAASNSTSDTNVVGANTQTSMYLGSQAGSNSFLDGTIQNLVVTGGVYNCGAKTQAGTPLP